MKFNYILKNIINKIDSYHMMKNFISEKVRVRPQYAVDNAFNFVNNNFTAEVYTNNILGLYQEVLNENSAIR